MNLKVEPAARYDGRFPNYDLPTEIGQFSVSSDGKYCNDNHQLKYLSLPNKMKGLHMDLNAGFSKYIHIKEDSENDYKTILRWIVTHQDEIEGHFRDNFNSRYKLLQWYLQSFLVGTPRVICGFRDDEGIVRELGTYNVEDMPRMASGMWSAAACLNFGLRFLDFVKEVVVKDYTEAEYLFSWRAGGGISCEEGISCLDHKKVSLIGIYRI